MGGDRQPVQPNSVFHGREIVVAIIRNATPPATARNEAPYRPPVFPHLEARPKEFPRPRLVVKNVKVTMTQFHFRPVNYVGWPKRPFEIIVRAVCELWNISRNDLLGEKHSWRYAHPRQAAYLLASDFSLSSIAGIGRFFGRDHTTVLHGIRQALGRADRDYQATIDAARKIIGEAIEKQSTGTVSNAVDNRVSESNRASK